MTSGYTSFSLGVSLREGRYHEFWGQVKDKVRGSCSLLLLASEEDSQSVAYCGENSLSPLEPATVWLLRFCD